MKFQSILLALSTASVAVACPAGKKPHKASSSVAATATSGAHQTTTIASSSSVSSAQVTSISIATTSSTSSAVAAASTAVEAVSSSSSSSVVSGEATFYGGNLSGGTCSFTTLSTIPNSLYGTAYSGAVWDSAAECGACVKVTGPNGNSITAMVRRPLSFRRPYPPVNATFS